MPHSGWDCGYNIIYIGVTFGKIFPFLTFYYLKFHLYILCFALGLLMCTPFGAGIGRRLVSANKTLLFVAFLSVSLFVSASALQIVLGYLWISSLLFSQDRWTWFLTRPSSLYFGRISYGLYLWHYPFAIAAYTPFALYAPWALGNHAIWYGLLTAPLIIPVTIMLAHASERWIERPFIDLGYRVSQRLVRPRAPDGCRRLTRWPPGHQRSGWPSLFRAFPRRCPFARSGLPRAG